MKHILILIALFFTVLTSAQSGSIVGALTDAETGGQPLPFANVIVKGTTKGAQTDFDGNFIIENLDVGTYAIEFSFVGYETVTVPNVAVEANKVTTINSELGASSAQLDATILSITTNREKASALLLEQRKATTITQAIGAEELARKGVSDAAGAVAQISGVSRQEGGSAVYVRGLGDRYLNTTYNGLSLPSNNIEKKNIDLDLFSSDVIQNVSVSKAYGANFYGDFAAGNIDITSKDYNGKGFLDVSLGSGVNTNAIGEDQFLRTEGGGYGGYYTRYNRNPYAVLLSNDIDPIDGGTPVNLNGTISGGKSYEWGDDSKISGFFTASFGNDFEYRTGRSADFTTVEKKIFPAAEEYEYSTNTTGMGTIVFRPNGDHKISYNSLFINNSSSTVGYFGINGQGQNRDAILDTDKGFYQQNFQFEQDLIFVNQLISNHKLNDVIEVDFGIGVNKVLARQPDRKRFSLERYDLAIDDDPNTNASFFNNINFDNQRYFQSITDDELTSRLSFTYTPSERANLTFGYNGRTKKRTFNNIRYGYDIIEPNTAVPDVNNIDALLGAENIGTVFNTTVINNIPTQGTINRPGISENTYTGNLDIHGVFLTADLKVGEKFTFVPGMRYESFNQNVSYDVINLIATDPGFAQSYENFLLPSLNVKYEVAPKQNLRFGISRTVSTPEFKETAPFVYEDVSSQVGGNPDLLRDPAFSDILNLDFKYEWFIGKTDLIAFSAFAKQINDPINLVVVSDATGVQRFVRTGDKADVLGLEVEVRKTLFSNEEDDAILSLGFNATVMDTKQDLKPSEPGDFATTTYGDRNEDELQGASPLLLNADISWTPNFGSYKPTANLVFSHFSDRIDAIGAGQLGNIIEKSVSTVDFIFKNEIGSNFEINASVRNLLNPTIEYVREAAGGDIIVNSTNGKGIASYKRGINLGLSINYTF